MSFNPATEVYRAVDSDGLGVEPWRRFFRASESAPYEAKRALQLRLLQALSQEFGLGIESWEDLGSTRLTSKSDLVGFVPHHPELASPYQTSGSSGGPFAFHRDRTLVPIDFAIFERGWRWVGRTDQLVLRLVSGEPKWPYYDRLFNIRPMNYRTVDESYVAWVVKHQPFLIHGVAGAIRDLVERVRAANGEVTLKGTKLYLMSEDTRRHREALAPFVSGVFMGYGTAECRTAASQCIYATLHVNMETSIVESVDHEIVLTNLFNKVMPFVRYRTGDAGEVVPNYRCPCGVTSDVIEGIEGKGIDYYADPTVLRRPVGWWMVSPISHQFAHVVKSWRLEVVPRERLIRVFVVPRTENLDEFDPFLRWLEGETGFRTERVVCDSLPDWRRKLIRVMNA